jgi:hypothetical protein
MACATKASIGCFTETVRATDLKTGRSGHRGREAMPATCFATHKVEQAAPAGETQSKSCSGHNPPVAPITNIYTADIWTAMGLSNEMAAQMFDFTTVKSGIPLEIYFGVKPICFL